MHQTEFQSFKIIQNFKKIPMWRVFFFFLASINILFILMIYFLFPITDFVPVEKTELTGNMTSEFQRWCINASVVIELLNLCLGLGNK